MLPYQSALRLSVVRMVAHAAVTVWSQGMWPHLQCSFFFFALTASKFRIMRAFLVEEAKIVKKVIKQQQKPAGRKWLPARSLGSLARLLVAYVSSLAMFFYFPYLSEFLCKTNGPMRSICERFRVGSTRSILIMKRPWTLRKTHIMNCTYFFSFQAAGSNGHSDNEKKELSALSPPSPLN